MVSILIVEKHDDWRKALVEDLTESGIALRSATTVSEMNEALQRKISILLLDMRFWGAAMYSEIFRLRHRFPLMGIVVITGKFSSTDHVQALKDGADHVLSTPLNRSILSATIEALSRRMKICSIPSVEKKNIWKFDRQSGTLIGPQEIKAAFSDRESALLAALLMSPYFPISRDRLLQILNISSDIYDPHRIDTIIYRIRKKLNAVKSLPFEIRNIYGQGYICIRTDTESDIYVWDGK